MAEIELKFSLPHNEQMHVLRQLKRQKNTSLPGNKELDAVYFDTQSHELHKIGLTLRVRSENGIFTQTVKREGEGGTATLLRDELEDEVDDCVPDLAAGKSGRAVRDVLGEYPDLRPLFRVRVRRTIVEIRKKSGNCVEAALDRGEIETIPGANGSKRSDCRRCPIHELELELKNGNDIASLFDVALSVSKTVPLRIEPLSKGERGYRLLERNKSPGVVHSPGVPLRKSETLGEVLRAAGRVYLEQFKSNIPAATEEEEGLHQMRVALRRLRAVLSFAKDNLPNTQYEWASQQLKSLLQVLGPARNWDVLRQTLEEVPDLPHRRTAAHHQLVKLADQKRKAAHDRATRAVSSAQETVSVLELSRWFENLDRLRALRAPKLKKRLNQVADKLLDKQFKRVRKCSKALATRPASSARTISAIATSTCRRCMASTSSSAIFITSMPRKSRSIRTIPKIRSYERSSDRAAS
jgi:inorganic triphosphatase YgiF